MAAGGVVAAKKPAFKPIAPKTCMECDQVVYPLEMVSAGHFTYHKWCFKCAQCNRVLSTASYEVAPSGIPYCRAHFLSTLRQRGGFEDFAVSYATAPTDSATVAETRTSCVGVRLTTRPHRREPVNRAASPDSFDTRL